MTICLPAKSFEDIEIWKIAHSWVLEKLGKADKLRSYDIAQGSLEECRYYLILARDLGYGDVEELRTQAAVIAKMLNSYMRAIAKDRC